MPSPTLILSNSTANTVSFWVISQNSTFNDTFSITLTTPSAYAFTVTESVYNNSVLFGNMNHSLSVASNGVATLSLVDNFNGTTNYCQIIF